jgi:hypothetical protein
LPKLNNILLYSCIFCLLTSPLNFLSHILRHIIKTFSLLERKQKSHCKWLDHFASLSRVLFLYLKISITLLTSVSGLAALIKFLWPLMCLLKRRLCLFQGRVCWSFTNTCSVLFSPTFENSDLVNAPLTSVSIKSFPF